MDIFNDEFLPWQPAKFLLCSFGAWPFQSLRVRRILSTLVICLVESLYIPEVIKFIKIWADLVAMMDCLPVLVPHTAINITLFICLNNLEKIRNLLSIVNIQWNESDLTDLEIDRLKRDGSTQRKIMVVYIFLVFFSAILYLTGMPMVPKILDLISPLNQSRPKMILYHTEFFIDQEKNALLFTIHSYIVSPFPTMIIVAYDVLYFNFIQHACTMFHILERRFQMLNSNEHTHDVVNLKRRISNNDKTYEYLVNCIIMHNNILQFIELININFSMSFLAIIAVNLVGISGTAFQILSEANEEKIRHILNNLIQVMHLYFLCWYSQKLINSSEQIHSAVEKWYDIPIKSQRLIVFILMMSRTPCAITAGGFAIMSIETFSSGMKSAMSYLTVLRSMQ